MRACKVVALLAAMLACGPAWAEDDGLLRPAISAGLSYPLVFSASMGLLLPVGRQDKDVYLPTSLALRADAELGLGGGSVGGGVYMPVRYFVVSLKAVRMRTWLWTWNEEQNRTFDGGVVEFALPSLHGGPKVGIGSFKDRALLNGRRDSFTYVFIGAGW